MRSNLSEKIIILFIIILICAGCPGSENPTPDETPVDIRADVNRNGTIDFDDPTEDANEDTWDASHGAIFLANLDDDENVFPVTGTDTELAGYTDAADDTINGAEDLNDLARLKTAPWTDAPDDAIAVISVEAASENYIRMFKKNGLSFEHFPLPGNLILSEIKNGTEFAIEAKDIVRDDAVWDGFVTVTYTISAESDTAEDSVILRVAPVIFLHNLYDVETVAATYFSSPESVEFRDDLGAAILASGISNSLYEINGYIDQWAGDFFTSACMSMPSTAGQHFIRLFIRSANYTKDELRTAGRVIYTDYRGTDAGTCVQYDPAHPDGMDTLNSFGNLIVIPPYSYNGNTWEFGRILRGSDESTFYPDPSFDKLIQAQGISAGNAAGFQDCIYIDTSWLLTGFVADVINFVPCESGKYGWVMLVADPQLAWEMLEDQEPAHGDTLMFEGKTWVDESPAGISISDVLSDTDLQNAQAWAVTEIAEIVDVIKSATGITDDDIISIPALFYDISGWLAAYMPSLITGIHLTSTDYAAADPHGPVIDSKDIFKDRFSSDLGSLGITVHYVEDWDLYHRLYGNVANGANAIRDTGGITGWWESGL